MSGISTHVLDTSLGRPAAGIPVILESESSNGAWREIGHGETDANGRVTNLLGGTALAAGMYRLVFDTGRYFLARNAESFYPRIVVTFQIPDSTQHYHLPLLLNPYGYSTYRGS